MINIIVDAFIGLIPIFGDALDVAFKANLRNLRLMEDHLISTNGKCHAGQFQLSFPPSNVFLPQDSPIREQPMPEVSGWSTGTSSNNERIGWNNTFSRASTSTRSRFGGPDFRNGTMEMVSSASIVPNEVFTTMRYEAQGITLHQMCAAIPTLSQRLQNKDQLDQIPLLERHISRLQLSVGAMKEHFPAEWKQCQSLQASEVRKKIEAAVKSNDGKGPTRRVRMSVNREGAIEVNTFAMAQQSSSTTLTVRFDDDSRIAEQTPTILFKYKTSHRQMYDDARSRVNATLGMEGQGQTCFDVIMLQSSFVTESSIANVLMHSHQDGQIYTPPACELPLLPGLMREELLSRGLIVEKKRSKEQLVADLSSGKASLYLCNALRGIIPVSLVQ
jgi:branched-subunit amino acid aminotransferase/4-amino-4-deoxychorismate lyase